jgi:hypothetical protein
MDWIYAILTLFAAFGWPWLLGDTLPQAYFAVVLLVNGIIAVNTWYQCDSAECPFFSGMRVIAGSMMSGCLNVTILYLPFLMAGVYLACLSFSAAGLLQGRREAQRRFRGLVEWFDRKRLNTPLNPFKEIKPIDPAEMDVSPDDPESIIHAAAMWDQGGEWDRAIGMYQLVRERWPEEYGLYAGNCIAEIERKKAQADGA